MDLPAETSTVLRIRKCVVCGEPFGAFRAITHGDDCGQSVREFVYSTRALPMTDHVHDDSHQDLSNLSAADLRLQAGGPTDQERVRSGFPSTEEMLADLERVSQKDPSLRNLVALLNELNIVTLTEAFDAGFTRGLHDLGENQQ